jgi:hypothetical protein
VKKKLVSLLNGTVAVTQWIILFLYLKLWHSAQIPIQFNPLNGSLNTFNAELNPICHLLALSEALHILHLSRVRVKIKYIWKFRRKFDVINFKLYLFHLISLGLIKNVFYSAGLVFICITIGHFHATIQQLCRLNVYGYNDKGLKTNLDKTEYMNTWKYRHKSKQSENKNTNYEEHHKLLEFYNLASLVTYDKDRGKDVLATITGGNHTYQALSNTIKSRYVSKHRVLNIFFKNDASRWVLLYHKQTKICPPGHRLNVLPYCYMHEPSSATSFYNNFKHEYIGTFGNAIILLVKSH